jgi:pyruvate dehydrogenase E1 component beta subunit
MAKITMREAISQALMEEMDRDPAVFIMGEEVGVWGGTYAVTKGFYDKYGPIARQRYTDRGERHHRRRNRRGDGGSTPCCRIDDHQLWFLSNGLHRQSGAETSLHVRRTVHCPDGHSRGRRRRTSTRRDTLTDARRHLRALPRSRGRVSPGTPEDAKGLLKSAIGRMIRFFSSSTPPCIKSAAKCPRASTIPIGKSKVQRVGKDLTIVTYCKGLELSMKAADELIQSKASKPRSLTCAHCARSTWNPCWIVQENKSRDRR